MTTCSVAPVRMYNTISFYLAAAVLHVTMQVLRSIALSGFSRAACGDTATRRHADMARGWQLVTAGCPTPRLQYHQLARTLIACVWQVAASVVVVMQHGATGSTGATWWK